jgi:hypothetical protein
VLERFFVIWVGSPVFNLPVLFNDKYRQINETAEHHFKSFLIEKENFKIKNTSADD